MSTAPRTNAGSRLTVAQALLAASVVAVVSATPLLTFLEHGALTRTVDDFGLAQNVTGNLADAQRDALLTVVAVERLDEDATTDASAVAAIEAIDEQLGFLGQQLRILGAQDLPTRTRDGVSDATTAYDELTGDVAALLAAGATAEQVLAARQQLDDGASRVQGSLTGLYSSVENAFYTTLSDQLAVRRDRQALVLGSAVLALLLGTLLTQSLRRSVRRDFGRAFALVQSEAVERAAAQDAAERTDRRFRALVQSSSDTILVVGDDLRVAYANPAAAALLGDGTGSRPVGMPFADLVAPAARAAADAVVVAGIRSPGAPVAAQLVLLTSDGGEVVVAARVTNLLDEPAVRGLVVNAHDVTEQVAHARELEHLAFHDRLTDLPNRLRLERELDALGTDGHATVVVLDLDDFGTLNERWGAQGGDRVLVRLARRLETVPGVTVFHLGGDEFALLGAGRDHDLDPHELVAAVRGTVGRPLDVDDHQVRLSAGLGVATASAASVGGHALLRLADSAMQEAKRKGPGSVVVLDEAHARAAEEQARLAEGLARALDAGELSLAYQPIVAATTREWVSVEALLRWDGPDGPVSPAQFIPVAEATGLIGRIGRWVLEQATGELARIRAHAGPALQVNVNVSASQLRDPDFLDHVGGCLAAAGLEPSALVLELTESAVLEDPAQAVAVLGAARDAGMHVALDDFGTGYSSMSYLLRLPVSQVKMDRSFVADLTTSSRNRRLLGALVEISHDLGMRVTVEGVETEEAMAAVVASGCDTVQGYLVSRPVPPHELTALAGFAAGAPQYARLGR